MDRGEMEHMLVGRVRQEGTPLLTCLQERRHEGNIAQLGHNPTDIETPMGVEIIHHQHNPLSVRIDVIDQGV